MKKLLLTIIFLAWAGVVQADDYWVYVSTIDKVGANDYETVNRMKKGDVIAVLPDTKQFIPSEQEKKTFLIFKTTLTDAQVTSMKEEWREDTGLKNPDNSPKIELKAYRKNKLDLTTISDKKGLIQDKVTTDKINLSVKTNADLSLYKQKQLFYAYIQKPLIQLANVITPFAHAATTVKKINCATEDYNTLELWEADTDNDLVTATTIQQADVYDDDGDLTTELTISGATVNSSYYRIVSSPSGERHNGTDTGATLINPGLAGDSAVIYINEQYAIVEYMNITNFKDATNSYTREDGIKNVSSNVTIRNNIIHDSATSGLNMQHRGIQPVEAYGSRTGVKVYNNIIYKMYGIEASRGIYIINYDDGNVLIYGNTVYGNTSATGYGIECYYSTCKNNISVGNDTDFVFGSSTSDYNISTDTTATGDNSTTGVAAADLFSSVTGGSENLHLKAGAVAIDDGVDLGSPYNYGIDGNERTGSWDIGADEYVSLGTTFAFGNVTMGNVNIN